jgi:RNA polymerase-binding transcription factor DksA
MAKKTIKPVAKPAKAGLKDKSPKPAAKKKPVAKTAKPAAKPVKKAPLQAKNVARKPLPAKKAAKKVVVAFKPKPKSKPAAKPVKKVAPPAKKKVASKKSPIVKPSPPKKPIKPAPKAKSPVPAKSAKSAPVKTAAKPKPAAKVPAKKAAPVAKKVAAPVKAPAPAPVAKAPVTKPEPKPVAKKLTKSGTAVPAPSKPVPLAKVKPPVDTNPEIVIKQAYNPLKMPPFYKKQQIRLMELRSSLYETMEDVAKETLRARPEGSDASVGGMHMGDAGSDAYDRDFALSMLSKEQDALYEINDALKRLDAGVYGMCELSGKKINEERLEAIPYTRYTREMQEQIEKDRMGGRYIRPAVRSVFGLEEDGEGDDDDEDEGTTTTTTSNNNDSSLDFSKE